jgi:hypothetical protein
MANKMKAMVLAAPDDLRVATSYPGVLPLLEQGNAGEHR